MAAVMRDIILKCPECGSRMNLKDSRHGKFFGCSRWPECNATHGSHPDGSPLGVPGDKATKLARMAAHERFDSLWRDGQMSRNAAYRLMRNVMGMTKDEAHIAKFSIEQCETLIRKLDEVR